MHIDNLCSTINSRLALYYAELNPFQLRIVLFDSITPVLIQVLSTDYCSVTWGNCSKSLLLRILRLQKRAARIILDVNFSTPSFFPDSNNANL
jgi:hypothetical protein